MHVVIQVFAPFMQSVYITALVLRFLLIKLGSCSVRFKLKAFCPATAVIGNKIYSLKVLSGLANPRPSV